jgi:dephospho-CoA kinase
MISVGLTGNVASGKSTVARLWSDAGIPVVSADELSRQAVAPGTPGLREVLDAFGAEVLATDGSLDRAALRGIVFQDDEARARLERILHPRIAVLRDRWLRDQWEREAPLVVSEVPLLFEAGLQDEFDRTVFIDSSEETSLLRLIERRGLDESESHRIMAAQMPPKQKQALADHVLDNDGDLEELRKVSGDMLDRLRGISKDENTVREGWMRIDLHLHTRASFDCLSDPEMILRRAAERGVDRIAITDHNRLELALDLASRYPDRVIPGEEVKTAEGVDVIGHYLTEEIPKGTPAHEVVDRIHDQGGLVYLPHPFAPGKGGGGRLAEELAPRVDLIEVFNARLHPRRLNESAEELAARHDKRRGAGSDAHTVGEVAGAFVEVPVHENRPDALLGAMRRSAVRGRMTPWLVHLASTWAKVRRRLP